MAIQPTFIGAILLTCASLVAFVGFAHAAESNGWRGPNRDGVAEAFAPPNTWPKTLRKQWELEVGTGHSSPLVVGDVIYQFSRQNDDELIRAIDLSGKEMWRKSYDAPYTMNNAARGHGKGPKATPSVSSDHILTLGIDGQFQCWRRTDGTLIWQAKELPQGSPLYGAATSPLLEDNIALIHLGKHNSGALVAFDPKTGKSRWKWAEDGPAYTSPVVMNFGGERQFVTQSQQFCLSFSDSGKLLWKIPFKTGYDQNSVTPIQAGGLAIFSGYRKGVSAYRPQASNGRWEAEEAWHNSDVSMYMSSPVLIGDRLLGHSERNKGQLFALESSTGKTLWLGPPRQGDNAAIWALDDVAVVLLTTGRLLVIDAKSDDYRSIAEYQVADTPTWAHPALSGKNILIKDETKLIMWSLE